MTPSVTSLVKRATRIHIDSIVVSGLDINSCRITYSSDLNLNGSETVFHSVSRTRMILWFHEMGYGECLIVGWKGTSRTPQIRTRQMNPLEDQKRVHEIQSSDDLDPRGEIFRLVWNPESCYMRAFLSDP